MTICTECNVEFTKEIIEKDGKKYILFQCPKCGRKEEEPLGLDSSLRRSI